MIRTRIFRPSHRGFSLLELSVVLGIIALIAGAGMTLASGALKAADRVATQERLNTIKLALDSYAKTYGYLPCPADRTLLPTNANFGVESRTTNNCVAAAGVEINGNTIAGTIPTRTLGLPDTYAGDSWGNKLTYAISRGLGKEATSYATDNNGSIGTSLMIRYGTRVSAATYFNTTTQRLSTTYSAAASSGGLVNLTVASSAGSGLATAIVHVSSNTPSTGYKGSYTVSSIPDGTHVVLAGSTYTATDAGTIEWETPGVAASYAVVSHGPDGRGAFPVSGTAVPGNKLCNTNATANTSPPPCTDSGTLACIDIENCNGDYIFYDTAYNDGTSPAQYFDDYIVWGSNASARLPVNSSLYSTCGTGPCEAWCAGCALNYPGGGTDAPPLAAALTYPVLCKKVITSNATTCTASCFWGGTNKNGKGTAVDGYQKCP